MEEFEPIRKENKVDANNSTTTTLVIRGVPSEIAFKFITGIGRFLEPDEQKEELMKIEGALYEEPYELKECNLKSQTNKEPYTLKEHNPEWRELEKDTSVCTCKECGAIIGYKSGDKVISDYDSVKKIYPSIFSEESPHHEVEESEYSETMTLK